MAMQISGNSGRPPPEAAEAGKSQAATANTNQSRAPATGKGNASGADQVKLSNQANQLQALEAEIANLPPIDVNRVEEVQRTLAASAYEIQPARVADRLLSFEAGLGKS